MHLSKVFSSGCILDLLHVKHDRSISHCIYAKVVWEHTIKHSYHCTAEEEQWCWFLVVTYITVALHVGLG